MSVVSVNIGTLWPVISSSLPLGACKKALGSSDLRGLPTSCSPVVATGLGAAIKGQMEATRRVCDHGPHCPSPITLTGEREASGFF